MSMQVWLFLICSIAPNEWFAKLLEVLKKAFWARGLGHFGRARPQHFGIHLKRPPNMQLITILPKRSFFNSCTIENQRNFVNLKLNPK